MRRFQCTNREFLAFTFRELYDEVECPEGFKRTHAESIFLIDNYGDVHEMWPEWLYHNFKELPGDELVPEPYTIRRASTEGMKIQDTDGITLEGIMTWCAVGFLLAISLIALFW